MGQILSKRHQNHLHHHHHHNHSNHHHHHQQLNSPPPPQSPTPPLPVPILLAPPPNPAPPPPAPPVPTSFSFAAYAPYPSIQPPPPTPPPPPPPPPQPQSFPYYPQYNCDYSNYARPSNVMGAQPGINYHPYFVGYGHGNVWDRQPAGMQLPAVPPPPVPYVDHQSAKKIKNDVNVHKDTIKLEEDEGNRDCRLVSFTFDAMVDGSITIYYYAKEGSKCTFTPVYPEMYVPVKIPFQKGLGQQFCQPSGSGIDLGFFDIDELSKPSDGDVFPLIISAESSSSTLTDGQFGGEAGNTSPHAQITQAVIEKNHDNAFKVKVIKQILWIDEVRYELREIFGVSDPDEVTINDNDSGKECVICMTEPKDTAVLPCRHMCMCSECAKELRIRSNKCPICRQPIEELLEIKVDGGVS